ncbi:MAG: PfkB family carbohydrate kinase [Anaerolineales bacterium]
MTRVVVHGELLIDFISTSPGQPLELVRTFERAAGGAPGNVAVGLARLGVAVAFMGQVGEDAFGRYLAATLQEEGVDTVPLSFTSQARTGLAFVSLSTEGEREFLFYRKPSADMLYTPDQVDRNLLAAASLLHVGSISLTVEPARSATLAAVEFAVEHGIPISFDPNLRLDLWPSAQMARQSIERILRLAQIIKLSEEELRFVSGESGDLVAAARSLWHPDMRILVTTEGPDGCTYLTESLQGHVAGFEVATVDTTGAGDGFMAGLLSGVLRPSTDLQDPRKLTAICRYANAVGALTTTARGAIPALPTSAAVADLLGYSGAVG